MTKRINLFLYYILFGTILARAGTGSLKGFVSNQQGNPISDVYVVISSLNLANVTTHQGYFFIENISPGKYTIKLEHISYGTKLIDNVQIEANETTTLDTIFLETRVYHVSDISVTASRSQRHRHDISYQINSISNTEIKARNAKTSAEVLREEIGIAVQKTSHGGGSAIIRGLSSNQILLLVDDIRLNNSTYRLGNHQYLTTVDNLMAQQIEVVRGPTSVLYGSDALGGTVNIISKKPKLFTANFSSDFRIYSRYASADQEKTARAEATLQYKNYALQTGISYKNYNDLLRGKNSEHPQLEKSTNGIKQTPSGYSAYDFDMKMLYGIDTSQTVTLAYQMSQQIKVPRYDKYENSGYRHWIYQPQKRDLLYLKYQNFFQSKSLQSLQATLSYHYQNEGREIQKSSNTSFTKENDNVHTFGSSLQINLNYNNHTIILGSELYLDKVYSERFITDHETEKTIKDIRGRYPDDAHYHSLGIFAQDEVELTSSWSAILGVRFSYIHLYFNRIKSQEITTIQTEFNHSYNSITGSIGTIYKISDNILIKSHIAQAFRAPNLSDLSKLGESKGNVYEIPNIKLEPEKLINIDLGSDIDFLSFTIHGAIFYTSFTDIITSADDTINGSPILISNSGDYKVKSKQNIGKAYIRGIELGFDYNIHKNIYLYSNLTSISGQNTTMNEPVGGMPPTFGLIGIKWYVPSYYLDLNMRFAGKQNRLSSDDRDDPRIPEEGTPAWNIFTIRTGIKLTDIAELCFSLENIFDYNYREHGSGINGPGRNFIFSLDLTF
jgi:outer membrane receptor for ferrienterochelin and colicin